MANHTTKLIEGSFTNEQAKTILLELLKSKINFHEKEKFSTEFRFVKDNFNSKDRLLQLRNEKQTLIEWLDKIDELTMLKIYCEIKIETI